MVPCKKTRTVSDITIGLQLENGERLTGEFSPTSNIADILDKLCGTYDPEMSVIIYMHREVRSTGLKKRECFKWLFKVSKYFSSLKTKITFFQVSNVC